MLTRGEVQRIATAIYRRAIPNSTLGLRWKRQGDHVTFEWDGFVAAPSIPFLFARHHYETRTIERLLGDARAQYCLEFGCGFGRLSPTLAALCRQHTALDINSSAIQAARASYPDIDFRTYDGNAIPFADATFDLVVTWTVLQHVPPSRCDDTLADILRVLKPTGRLLLCEETRFAGSPSAHTWHREPQFYEQRLAPFRLAHSSYMAEIDRVPGLTSPGQVMLFEPR